MAARERRPVGDQLHRLAGTCENGRDHCFGHKHFQTRTRVQDHGVRAPAERTRRWCSQNTFRAIVAGQLEMSDTPGMTGIFPCPLSGAIHRRGRSDGDVHRRQDYRVQVRRRLERRRQSHRHGHGRRVRRTVGPSGHPAHDGRTRHVSVAACRRAADPYRRSVAVSVSSIDRPPRGIIESVETVCIRGEPRPAPMMGASLHLQAQTDV